MAASLGDYGQLSPIIVCQLDGQMVLVDGFKRLRAARSLKGFSYGLHRQLCLVLTQTPTLVGDAMGFPGGEVPPQLDQLAIFGRSH